MFAEAPDQAPSPPELLEYSAAELSPMDAPSERTAVDLELEIDEQGRVVSARALSDSPEALRRAALLAAQRFVFTPARRGDQPIAVLIQYRYWFEAAAPATPVPAEPVEPGQPPLGTSTPSVSAGNRELPSLDTGVAETEAAPTALPSRVSADAEDEVVYEAVAEVQAPPSSSTRRRVSGTALTTTAGTRGDPLRAIEVLPGVARSSGGAPIIRGAAGNESLVLLDGTHIPILYHFGGVTSVVHPGLIERVNLYPGNFSSRYGRTVGGVVEAELRAPKTETELVADVNLIDSSVLVDVPLAERVGMSAAVRRSNIDFVFENFVPDGTFQVLAAPLYWDYQAVVQFDLAASSRLRAFVFGARDELSLVFAQPSRSDPGMRGGVGASLEFHRLQLLHEARLGSARQRLQATLGTQSLAQGIGPDAEAFFEVREFDARAEWQVPVSDTADLIGGLDVTGQHLLGAYAGSVASASEGALDFPEAARGRVVIDETTIGMFSPAAYLEARISPDARWLLMPGLRLDYSHQLQALTVDPRLSQRYSLTDTTTLKTGVGWYSQPPLYYEAFAPIGNPELDPYHALHLSAGAEQRWFDDALALDVEGFYKQLYHRVVGTEGGVPPRFVNDGRGRIYGAEVGAALDADDFSASLAYTLSRSERQDRNQAWRLFDEDQTHVLNLVAALELGAGFQASSRFRVVTGNPQTPVAGAVFDAGRGSYVPVFGAHNSSRDPAFVQLDLRVEKDFRVGPGRLTVYTDVQNVTNSDNPEGYMYSYDYQSREPVSGLPFFPNLGVRGEL